MKIFPGKTKTNMRVGTLPCKECGTPSPEIIERRMGFLDVRSWRCPVCGDCSVRGAPPYRGGVRVWGEEPCPMEPVPTCINCYLPLHVDDDGGEYVHPDGERRCLNMPGRNWKGFLTDAEPVFDCAVVWQEDKI